MVLMVVVEACLGVLEVERVDVVILLNTLVSELWLKFVTP